MKNPPDKILGLEISKRTASLFMIIFSIVGGVLLLAFPEQALSFVGIVLGIICLLYAVKCFYTYFHLPVEDAIGGMTMTAGILSLGLAILFFARPMFLEGLIPFIWGIYFLVGGVQKIQTAIDLMRLKDRYWFITLILAVVSVAIGIIALCNKDMIVHGLAVLFGIFMLVEGVLDLVAFFQFHRAVKKHSSAA